MVEDALGQGIGLARHLYGAELGVHVCRGVDGPAVVGYSSLESLLLQSKPRRGLVQSRSDVL
jgi:hypothetical protein